MRRGIRGRTVTLLGLTETRKSNGKVYTYLRRKGGEFRREVQHRQRI